MKYVDLKFDGLVVDDLHVKVEGKHILKGINLKINKGETHVIFGPNGSGKSTLLKVIMGIGNYEIIKGSIYFNGKDITFLSPDQKAKLGIGLSFQKPPSIKGVKLKSLLALLNDKHDTILSEAIELFKFKDHLQRDINLGFSGGELKKSEILQLIAQNPDLIMLDEPESGVDLENLKLIGKTIANILESNKKNIVNDINFINNNKILYDNKINDKSNNKNNKNDNYKKIGKNENNKSIKKMGLIITHTGYILDYINADKAHILLNGRLICNGDPLELFKTIEKHGFKECELCKFF